LRQQGQRLAEECARYEEGDAGFHYQPSKAEPLFSSIQRLYREHQETLQEGFNNRQQILLSSKFFRTEF
jgi:hypothetical protein